MADKFIKKPVVIEAMPFDGSWESAKPILDWIVDNKALDLSGPTWFDRADGELRIHTLEGTLSASAGDWIIRGIKGEFYPCKPDIFKETYEPAFTDAQDACVDGEICSVCGSSLTPYDICATDTELGICHATCLEGSPAVDLDTDEPCETVQTFRYDELSDDAVGEIATPRHPVAFRWRGIGEWLFGTRAPDGVAAEPLYTDHPATTITAPALPTAYHIVFDGFPSPNGPRFIELEDQNGHSLGIGAWRKREYGHAELVLPSAAAPITTVNLMGWVYDHDHAMSDGNDTRMTAAEEVLAYLLVEVIGAPDDVPYSPNEAQVLIENRLKDGKRLEEVEAGRLARRRAALAAKEGQNDAL